jgi:hypothetical protein
VETENNERGLGELVSRAVADVKEAQDLLAAYNKAGRNTIESWAGELLQPMLHNRSQTEKLLSHQDVMVRLAALVVIKDYWPAAADMVKSVERLAFSDPEPRVRGVAVVTLLRYHSYMSDWSKRVVAGMLHGAREEYRGAGETRNTVIDEVTVKGRDERARARNKELWEALAGSALPEMLESLHSTRQALHAQDAKLRMAGLLLLCNYWPRGEDLERTCQTMAFEDSDSQARAVAIGQLGLLYKGTNDRRLGVQLAKLVYDILQPPPVRRAAYTALFKLRGIPLLHRLHGIPVYRRVRNFPEDCNWAFVDTFLEGENTDSENEGRRGQ